MATLISSLISKVPLMDSVLPQSCRNLFYSLLLAVVALTSVAAQQQPPAHDQFKVAVYIPVGVVQRMKDPAYLEKSWTDLSSQVRVDKVYIEDYRSGVFIDESLLAKVKAFFVANGVQVAGGIAYVGSGDNAGFESPDAIGDGTFVSMCYTDPKERELVKRVAETAARQFDEIILDDFFFNNTKRESDIAAKGDLSWTAFRLRLMDQVSRELVLGPARKVNPRVKVIIKFPNWYEHFPANGYDLDQEPKIFDGIYTGTETRDPVMNDQHLQQYESYEIIRYLDNVALDAKGGPNGGGWVDTYGSLYIDRYAEQLWDTMLAKAPQIMLFQYSDMLGKAELGNRKAWAGAQTSFSESGLEQWHANSHSAEPVSWATAAGYALNTVNGVVGSLGEPIGIASYKPYQSLGDDFLQNYLGMIGLPIEMRATFPSAAEAHTVLLTEQAKYDPQIVEKIKRHLTDGGNVVITANLLKALEGRGAPGARIEDIADLHVTGNSLRMDAFWGGFGRGIEPATPILVPEIAFQTNDAWPMVRGLASGNGAPLVLMDKYAHGILYVLAIPENPADLYLLPEAALAGIRQVVMTGFPVRLDGPAKVSLFAYDNKTFAVENFLDSAAPVTISVPAAAQTGTAPHIRNLVSGETIEGKPAPRGLFNRGPERTEFKFEIPPHSFAAFAQQ